MFQMAGRELPELNYKPTPLKKWYLVSILILFVVCLGGSITLVILGHIDPTWLRFASTSSYHLWYQTPGLIGFLITILWRSTVRWYNRIIPYARMYDPPAMQPSRPGKSRRRRRHHHLHSLGLNGLGGSAVNPGMIIFLWRCGDYLSVVVNVGQFLVIVLTPLKTMLIRLVREPDGWAIHISPVACGVIAFVFAWLSTVTVCVLVFFGNHRTGLRWSPTTLATQISLVQGSNVLGELAHVGTRGFMSLPNSVREWKKKGWILRLGYWRHQTTGWVTYGVRLLSTNPEWPLRGDETQGPATASPDDDDEDNNDDSATRTVGASSGHTPEAQLAPTSRRNSEVLEHATPPPTSPARSGRFDDRDIQDVERPSLQRDDGEGSMHSIKQHDNTRIDNFFQRDPYLCFATAVGVGCLAAATVLWVRGDLDEPFQLPMAKSWVAKQGGAPASFTMTLRAERALALGLAPMAVFGVFGSNFLVADVYHRTMVPISRMGGWLDEEDRARIRPRAPASAVLGASARKSVLLDYLTPDPVSCIVKAVDDGEYRLALAVLLATLSNSLYLLLAQLFYFDDLPGQDYAVRVNLRVFYASYAILVVYCASIWILRPTGTVRTCRPLYTLLDTALNVHQSPIMLCPEFCCPPFTGLDERQFQAQILLADRVHSYGVYAGMDGGDYIGVTADAVPESWYRHAASAADELDLRSRLELAAVLSRMLLTHGCFDKDMERFRQLDEHLAGAGLAVAFLGKYEHRSWRKWARSRVRRRGERMEETEKGLRRRRQTDVDDEGRASGPRGSTTSFEGGSRPGHESG